jgi:hypothetical protein
VRYRNRLRWTYLIYSARAGGPSLGYFNLTYSGQQFCLAQGPPSFGPTEISLSVHLSDQVQEMSMSANQKKEDVHHWSWERRGETCETVARTARSER